jgi:hypothetical protein
MNFLIYTLIFFTKKITFIPIVFLKKNLYNLRQHESNNCSSSNGIAWTLNPSGARMDGSLAPVAYQHSNGSIIFIVFLSIFKILFLMLISRRTMIANKRVPLLIYF